MVDPVVRRLDDPAEHTAAAALIGRVWHDGAAVPIEPPLFTAVHRAGGYVAGAFVADELIGAALGFLGRHHDRWVLHSHVTGVLPGREHAGIGAAIKHHQRAWARAEGLDAVVWTFDPLVRRNAWFNVAKLGARVGRYVESYYGTFTDSINQGDETDRVVAWWPTDPTAPDPERAAPRTASIERHTVDDTGAVHAFDPTLGPWTIATPADVVGLRATDPDAARRWRHAVRIALGGALHAGAVVTGFDRSGHWILEES